MLSKIYFILFNWSEISPTLQLNGIILSEIPVLLYPW